MTSKRRRKVPRPPTLPAALRAERDRPAGTQRPRYRQYLGPFRPVDLPEVPGTVRAERERRRGRVMPRPVPRPKRPLREGDSRPPTRDRPQAGPPMFRANVQLDASQVVRRGPGRLPRTGEDRGTILPRERASRRPAPYQRATRTGEGRGTIIPGGVVPRAVLRTIPRRRRVDEGGTAQRRAR